MLHIVNVDGIEPVGHEILVDVAPPAKDTDRPAPFPATLPTLTVPAVSPPCRAFPLRSVNRLFTTSHASADVARYAGFAAKIAASGSAPAVYVPALHTQAAAEVAPGAEVVPAGHARQSDVRFTQLFSCADAWAKTSFDRCVFQIYSLENCQSLSSPLALILS